jgi:DNA-cytosine methyltransferase
VERGRESDADIRTGRAVPAVASWFTGVGGIDLGFEYAGFRLVSVSEILDFPSAVLATHWPRVRNLGDITAVLDRIEGGSYEREEWMDADVWVGGFPCQDLSIAGPRAGLYDGDGNLTRSGLALAFLRLAGHFKPSWIVLENVTGLLNSHGGADLRLLLEAISQLGYGWAFRVLNSAGFGVPQRRRRVFIVASLGDPTGERAGSVLDLTDSRSRYLATGDEQGKETLKAAARVAGITRRSSDGQPGPDIVGTIPAALGHHGYTLGQEVYQGHLIANMEGEASYTSRNRTASGLPRWMDDPRSGYLAAAQTPYRKVHRQVSVEDAETWEEADIANTLNTWDIVSRDTHVIVNRDYNPEGYDTNRYKAMGNAVSVPVAYWLGRHLLEEIRGSEER